MCVSILCITLYEKFSEGGWMTALLTTTAIGVCVWVRKHYNEVRSGMKQLDNILAAIKETPADKLPPLPKMDPKDPTAVITVHGFNGFGLLRWDRPRAALPRSDFSRIRCKGRPGCAAPQGYAPESRRGGSPEPLPP